MYYYTAGGDIMTLYYGVPGVKHDATVAAQENRRGAANGARTRRTTSNFNRSNKQTAVPKTMCAECIVRIIGVAALVLLCFAVHKLM